jgi:hypothetical protein
MSIVEKAGSTPALSAPAARVTRLDSTSLKVTQWRVIRSEWIKLRSVRSCDNAFHGGSVPECPAIDGISGPAGD